mmetsp:Transcript_62243/g.110632  ORF Transcript_62243/g.110632 Transcript_62243/m.110632 type:complete len:167 (+) Transcript_62243:225-725(+)
MKDASRHLQHHRTITQDCKPGCQVFGDADEPSILRHKVQVELWRSAAIEAMREVGSRSFQRSKDTIALLLQEIQDAGSADLPEMLPIVENLRKTLSRVDQDEQEAALQRRHTVSHVVATASASMSIGQLTQSPMSVTSALSETQMRRRTASAAFSSGSVVLRSSRA